MIRRLGRDMYGATAIEFALLAPLLFTAIFGLIEGGRMLWMSQALSEAAYSTVRCKEINRVQCGTAAQQLLYAQARAAANGVRIEAGDVAIRSGIVCRGQPGSSEVLLSVPFSSAMGLFRPASGKVEARACMPTL